MPALHARLRDDMLLAGCSHEDMLGELDCCNCDR